MMTRVMRHAVFFKTEPRPLGSGLIAWHPVRSLTVAAPIRAPGASPVTGRVRELALAALMRCEQRDSRH